MKHVFTLLLLLLVSSGMLNHVRAQTEPVLLPLRSAPSVQSAKQTSARKQAPGLNATAAVTIRYVKAGSGGNGSSWSNASGDLQAMINASASGDQVWVAGGTYKPSTTGLSNPRDASFSLRNGVSVLGGFTGAAGTEGNVSARTATPSSTTLSGDIGTVDDNSDNAYHVVLNSNNGLDNSAVLDGFIITAGNASNSGSVFTNRGGGMYNLSSSPSVSRCVFVNNSASDTGGGLCDQGQNSTYTDCSFVGNSASFGGGMGAFGDAITCVNCFFGQNSVINNGGGLTMTGDGKTVLNLTNCTFRSNRAALGQAIRVPAGSGNTVNLINDLLWDNGGQNAISLSGSLTARYSLIEAGETDYTDGGNNQTLTTSPFDNATGPQLSRCAPAVDAGNDAANTTTTDVLGNTRKLRTIDIGAAEYQGIPYVAPTISNLFQSATTVCQGSPVSFRFDITTSSSDGVTSANFYRDNTNLGDAGVSFPPRANGQVRRTFSINESGTYKFVAVSTCSSLTITYAPITVNPLPASYSVTGGGAYCAGSVGSVVGLSGSETGVNYQLLRAGTATGTPVAGTGNPITFGPQSTTGTYTVLATNVGTSCTQTMSGSAVVSVNALPTVTITPAATTLCAGQSTNLTASGATTYRWSTGAMTASISVSAAGPYSVTGTTTTGCSNTATASVTVTPLPNAGFTGLPTSVCVDAAPSTLTPATPGGSFSGPGISGSSFSPASAGAGGPYSITYTVSSQGCPNTSVQTVTVKPLPTAPAITTRSGQPYPAGVSSLTIAQNTGNVLLMVSGCAGGTITWSGGNATTLAVSTASTGTQSFTATCTSNGCTSPVGTATVTVVAPTLKVLSRDPDNGQLNNNTIKPYLLLQNAGNTPIPYSTITLRYWLTTEPNIPLLFQKNYVAVGQGNLNLRYVALDQPRQGATGYIEYSFSPSAGILAPMGDSGPLEIQVNKQNYSVFDQRDDYSYVNNNSAYFLNPRITAYQNGVIFYGQEPTSVGSARQGAAEAGLVLAVRVLGNPVPGSSVSVEVSGAEGQLLRYELTDVRGQVVGTRQVAQAGTTDQQTFNVSQQPAGLLLLRVSTSTQSQTVKVLRQ